MESRSDSELSTSDSKLVSEFLIGSDEESSSDSESFDFINTTENYESMEFDIANGSFRFRG